MSSSPSNPPRSMFGVRLAAWYAVVFVGSSVLLMALTYVLLASSLRQRDHEIIQSTLQKYVAAYATEGLRGLDDAIRSDRVAGQHETLFVRAIGADAEAIYFSSPENWSGFDLHQLDVSPRPGDAVWSDVRADRDADILEVASVRLVNGIIFQVGKSAQSRIELLGRYRTVLLAAFATVIIIGLTGGAFLTHSAVQPIRHLTDAVRRIMSTGRIDARVPVAETRDALDELTRLFNQMLDRIESLIAGMRGALDNVAHDLRTPMMRLRGTAEAALQTADPAAQREALADCLEESDRVVAMLNTLMDISEAETGTMKLARETIDVARLFDETVELYADLAEEKQQTLTTSCPPGLTMLADHNRLRQVLANLVDNAVKYTPAGGRVGLNGRLDGDVVVIEVRDSGVGIPAEDQPRVWERLYRGDASRSERGLGLGLSLVRAIVEAHGGRVALISTPGEGSTFQLMFPQRPVPPQA